ncbi:hypothetical protein D3C87_39280 [compost metagenome]
MKYLLTLSVLTLLIPLALSQRIKKLSPDAYVNWCSSPDFAWKNKDTLNGITYAVRFVPDQYDIAKCALSRCETKEVLLNDLNSKDKFGSFVLDLACLEFSKDLFSYPSQTGMNAAERKIYLSNLIKEDLIGISRSNDTIRCTSVIYETNIPTRARVIFELEKSNAPITKLVFTDRMINNSLIEFSIPELTKKNIPDLNLKKYE